MLSDIQQDIIRGCYGEFNGDLMAWQMRGMYKPYYFNLAAPGQRVHAKDSIKIQETPDTDRACRQCQGKGFIYAIFQSHGNMVVRRGCPQCGGAPFKEGRGIVHG